MKKLPLWQLEQMYQFDDPKEDLWLSAIAELIEIRKKELAESVTIPVNMNQYELESRN